VFIGVIRDTSRLSRVDEYCDLLAKFVPPSFSERLIAGETQLGNKYRATVGVLDLVGFTKRIAAESASVAFNALGEIWAAFDAALAKFHCQRVKTNGDIYVYVTELTPTITAHAVNGALMAKYCVDMIKSEGNDLHKKLRGLLMNDYRLTVRAGIATGELIAGIVLGVNMSFEVIGDCVNLAATLKKVATINTVLCCEATFHYASYCLEFAEPRLVDGAPCYELKREMETFKGGGMPSGKSARFKGKTTSVVTTKEVASAKQDNDDDVDNTK